MDLVTQLCSLMGLLALFQSFIPPQLRHFLDQLFQTWWAKLFSSSSHFTYLDVPECDAGGGGFNANLLYHEVEVYLSSLKKAMATQRVNIYRSEASKPLTFSLANGEEVEDSFQGAQLWWVHDQTEKGQGQGQPGSQERRNFSLRMLKTDRAQLLTDYLNHISKTAAEIERLNTDRYLYTNNGGGYWEQVTFNHPSTFDTLALDPDLKGRIQADLKAFQQGEEFYHRVGRAWKRGYLLYGPPGTGKSSMIAAISNFLHYDVYDLELTKAYDNASLRSLLIQTSKRSIIVIEDIDCTIDLSDRSASKQSGQGGRGSSGSDSGRDDAAANDAGPENSSSKVTLSGILNFTDGLWSCCGEERIFIFTTNHKERLDPALLRSGRMDFHILLSYCTFPAFRVLASNYVGIEEHKLYPLVEEAMESGAEITPAELGEILIGSKEDPDKAMEGVMCALRKKASAGKGDGSEEKGDEVVDVEREGPKRAEEKASGQMKGYKKGGRRKGNRLQALLRLNSSRSTVSPIF